MKNSINLILVIVLIVLFPSHSFAQFEEIGIDINQNVVISPNGLTIRSQPNLNSKKLGVVPFGKKVKIEEDKSYGWDTIGKYQYSWGDYSITGHWVKAKYENIRGYVFSAYLYNVPNNRDYDSEMMKQMNNEYALLYPDMNCFANINLQPNMNWYGLYYEDGIYHLKKINISFYRIYSDMLDFGISTSDNQALQFIIGSKKPLKEKIVEGKDWERFSDSFYQYEENDFEEIKNYGIEIEKENEQYGLTIQLNQGSKTQLLNPKEMEISHAMSIQWAGDLDGDGQMDFIFHYGEKSGQTILYLSSEAKDGKIVKPVAAYFSGYCC